MTDRDDIAMHKDFYDRHKLRNPSLVFFLILITCGLYSFWWFYLIAKDLEKIDNEAPSELRALYIFVLIPATLFLVLYILSFSNLPYFVLSILSNWGAIIVLLLILKFYFDFCESYAKFTKTISIYWFLGYFSATLGVIALFFQNYYLAPLILIFPIIIPAMQANFNFWVDRLKIKKRIKAFYF